MNAHAQLMPAPVRRGVRGVQAAVWMFATLTVWSTWEFFGGWLALGVFLPTAVLAGAIGQIARIAWMAGYSAGHADSLQLWSKYPHRYPAAHAAQNITAAANIQAGQRVTIRRNGEVIPLSQ